MLDFIRSFTYRLGGHNPQLLGMWERLDDDFLGCVIIVEAVGESLQGRITFIPDAMRNCGWQVGDLKWSRIARRSNTSYTLRDMYKEYDFRKLQVTRVTYGTARLEFVADNEILVVADEAAPRRSRTRWRRTGAAAGTTS